MESRNSQSIALEWVHMVHMSESPRCNSNSRDLEMVLYQCDSFQFAHRNSREEQLVLRSKQSMCFHTSAIPLRDKISMERQLVH